MKIATNNVNEDFRILSGNPMNIHRIPTKLGTEIHLNEPFKCTKLQPDWSTHSCFMADCAKCAKRRKNEEKKTKLWPLVSRKWLERFSSNLECALPYLAGTSVATLVSIGLGITELQMCENRVYFLPVMHLSMSSPPPPVRAMWGVRRGFELKFCPQGWGI